MDMLMIGVLGLLAGSGLGFAGGYLWRTRQLAAQQAEVQEARKGMQNELRQVFSQVASEALSANTTQLIAHAKAQLELQQKEGEGVFTQKSQQVAQTLGQLKEQLGEKLGQVQAKLDVLEKERAQQYTALDARLSEAGKVIGTLQQTTGSLREALTNSRVRGQWGERMAGDVLRLAGLQEGISYHTQGTLADGSRPDFTFPLPSGRVLHMDVKFPLDGYLAMLNAESEDARQAALKAFVQATRQHLKAVHGRGYLGDAQGLDYVLVFIPNEQVYATLFEADPALLDAALKLKVILCSPTTLLAVLALIRQAEAAFKLEAQFAALAQDLAGFRSQWDKFIDAHDGVKKAFDGVAKRFEDLLGTRTRQLEKSLDKLLLTSDQPPRQAAPASGAVAGAVPSSFELN